MEKLNLEILNNKRILGKFYAMNGISQEARTELVREILVKGEVFSNTVDMEKFLEDKTNTRKVLDAYLDVLNLRIED